jgi:hypothetical protein
VPEQAESLWCRWPPAEDDEVEYAKVLRAVSEFEPLENDAGREAAQWLKEKALLNHPATLTYLLLCDERVEGFFAICSASVELTQSHRKKLASNHGGDHLLPTQGASLVTWLAKHREGRATGRQIMAHGVSIAREVAGLQGNLAFVLDPFDDKTKAMWEEKFKFKKSKTKMGEGPHRLWAPLHFQ